MSHSVCSPAFLGVIVPLTLGGCSAPSSDWSLHLTITDATFDVTSVEENFLAAEPEEETDDEDPYYALGYDVQGRDEIATLYLDDPAAPTLEFEGWTHDGVKDGDSWVFDDSYTVTLTTDYLFDGDYAYQHLEGTKYEWHFAIDVSGDELSGDYVFYRTDETVYRESDAWTVGDDTTYYSYLNTSDLVDQSGEEVENDPSRDDCEGDLCEIGYLAVDTYNYDISGQRL